MKKTFVIVIWFALVVPSVARAQGEWLQRGVSGVEAELAVSHNSGANELSATGGYSHQGFLDVNVTLGLVDTTIAGLPDLNVYTLGLDLAYHPLKQSKQIPLSVSVALGYSQNFYSSDTLSENDASLSSWATMAVAGAYRFIPVAERIGVIPRVTLGWVHRSSSLTALDETQTNTDDLLVIALQGGLAYLDAGGHIWGVAPSVIFGPGNTPTTFGISVTFLSTLQALR
jgi:hypothetical protein